MNLINAENITKYYTDTPLFEEASFTIDEMEKVGSSASTARERRPC